jgi:hypothetical protein
MNAYKFIVNNNCYINITKVIMENKGYVLGGLAFLLILPSILLLIVLVDIVNLDVSEDILIKSDTAFYISGDFERNIPRMTRLILKETVENAIRTGDPVPNSRILIRNSLQSKINDLSIKYQNNSGVNVKCMINSVDSALDPFQIEVNSSISVMKDNISYFRKNSQKISILGLYPSSDFSKEYGGLCEIPDPLPFIKCKKFGDIMVKNGKIFYKSSLTKYLSRVIGAEKYENASSPYYIKKCPYNPYTYHGMSKNHMTLKNCIENGYYHESSDGACILCRLEGKSTCVHYGFETFIILAPSNKDNIKAPCSIDHVLFGNNLNDIYPGEYVEYYRNKNISYNLFLDNGHKSKYGINQI